MLEKVNFPLTNGQISAFILDQGYTTYFNLQQAINELLESDLIQCETVRNHSQYRITPSGSGTLEYFQNKISAAIRQDIDDYLKDPKLYEANMEWYKEEIGKCTYREFTTGFYFGKPGSDAQIYNSNTYVKNYTYLGTVEEADGKGRCRIEQKNKFSVGETIEIMKPDGRNLEVVVKSICDEDGNEQESAPHPKQILWVDLGADVDKYDILRKKEDN